MTVDAKQGFLTVQVVRKEQIISLIRIAIFVESIGAPTWLTEAVKDGT